AAFDVRRVFLRKSRVLEDELRVRPVRLELESRDRIGAVGPIPRAPGLDDAPARRQIDRAPAPPIDGGLGPCENAPALRRGGAGRELADIVLINPRFEVSFWGLEHALPLMGKRAALPVAALPLIAALTPAEHRVTIVDENVEAIDFARCAHADIVGVTGMVVQRRRMREILTELKRRGAFTAGGGPWGGVRGGYFGDLADVGFFCEAEGDGAR